MVLLVLKIYNKLNIEYKISKKLHYSKNLFLKALWIEAFFFCFLLNFGESFDAIFLKFLVLIDLFIMNM